MGGLAYHVLNRAVGRGALFDKEADYQAFEKTLVEAFDRFHPRILCYCLMPNHWHLVLWPREDGELSEFMRWLTVTHTQRWHAHRETAGTGPVYQGRFKSFPIQEDHHLLRVCRYVERNALRANLVERAEDWPWCSLHRRRSGADAGRILLATAQWPAEPPQNWLAAVNRPESSHDLEALRRSVRRGAPYGEKPWVERTARQLGLESSLRTRGRPRKQTGPPRVENQGRRK